MKKEKLLTPQQEKFALAIAAGNSQADAYREAYPRSKKWKAESVHEKASTLMANVKVRSRVDDLRKKVEEHTLVHAAKVIGEISRLAFFDVRKLVNEDGSPKSLHEIDDDTAAAIAGLDVVSVGNAEVGVGSILKYKIADKNSALEKLCKHLGLYEKDNGQAGKAAGEGAAEVMRRITLDFSDVKKAAVGK